MKLSEIGDLLSLMQTRHELGHIIGAIDRGEPLAVSSLVSEGHLIVPRDKLPAGFETALRGMFTELDDQIRGLGVDPDLPMVPEFDEDVDEADAA